jgi:hypothetical protein
MMKEDAKLQRNTELPLHQCLGNPSKPVNSAIPESLLTKVWLPFIPAVCWPKFLTFKTREPRQQIF